jgi:hypothetical protein
MKKNIVVAFLALVLLAIVGATADAQILGQGPVDDVPIWRVIGALLLCILLALGGALAIRVRTPGGSILPLSMGRDRRLSIIESLRVGQHCELCIVACDGREILLLTSAHGGSMLCDLGKSHSASEASS